MLRPNDVQMETTYLNLFTLDLIMFWDRQSPNVNFTILYRYVTAQLFHYPILCNYNCVSLRHMFDVCFQDFDFLPEGKKIYRMIQAVWLLLKLGFATSCTVQPGHTLHSTSCIISFAH